MPRLIPVTDPAAEEVALFRVSDAYLRAPQRVAEPLFMAESAKVVSVAMDQGIMPVAFLMEEKHIEGQAREVLQRCPADIPLYTGSREVLSQIVGYHPDRCIQCLMKRPPLQDMRAVLKNARRVAVLENVTDTTNAGAIFRSAAALGVDAVLLTPECCDPLNRRSVRVSMGTIFQVPWAFTPAWPEDGLAILREAGFRTAALALTDKSVSLDDPLLAKEEKLAFILGTEGTGLKNETIAGCDHTVRIPMLHGVDSLNVAAAAAVAFWELRAR